jgi:hypothetical protein
MHTYLILLSHSAILYFAVQLPSRDLAVDQHYIVMDSASHRVASMLPFVLQIVGCTHDVSLFFISIRTIGMLATVDIVIYVSLFNGVICRRIKCVLHIILIYSSSVHQFNAATSVLHMLNS